MSDPDITNELIQRLILLESRVRDLSRGEKSPASAFATSGHTHDFTGPDHLNVGAATGAASGDVKASGSGSFSVGLNVGSSTGATAGQIKASASSFIAGGLNVGSATTAGTGDVKGSGSLSMTGGANLGSSTGAAAGDLKGSGNLSMAGGANLGTATGAPSGGLKTETSAEIGTSLKVGSGPTPASGDISYSGMHLGGGTSFPGSPPSGKPRFWRTDRDEEYFWDGTRWLTTKQFPVTWIKSNDDNRPYTVTNEHKMVMALNRDYDTYLTSFYMSHFVQTTNGAGNYWIQRLYRFDTSNVITQIGLDQNTSLYSAGSYNFTTTALNFLLARATYGIISFYITIGAGAPGPYYADPLLYYRLVG